MLVLVAAQVGCVAPKVTVVLVAQWIAYQTSDLGVAGSSPAGDCLFFSHHSFQQTHSWPSG